MVSAICSVAPSHPSMLAFNLLKSASDAPTIARSPDIASCPASAAAVLALSDSDRLENPSRKSSMISFRDFMLPSEFVIETPSLSIAS